MTNIKLQNENETDIEKRLEKLEELLMTRNWTGATNRKAMNDKEIIRAVMKKKQLSQDDLAGKIPGWKQTNVSGLLNNRKRGVRIDNLYKVFSAMGCEIVIRDQDQEWVYVPDQEE